MEALNDVVLVIPDEEESEQFSPGGLALPASMKSPIASGVVYSISEDIYDVPVEDGSRVYYLKGDRVKWTLPSGTKVTLIKYEELVAVDE